MSQLWPIPRRQAGTFTQRTLLDHAKLTPCYVLGAPRGSEHVNPNQLHFTRFRGERPPLDGRLVELEGLESPLHVHQFGYLALDAIF